MLLDHVKNQRTIVLGLALVALALLVYWPAMHNGGFIWDDDFYVSHNRTLRDADGLVEIWTTPRATPQYYPLVHTTYWLEYRLWKLDPTGYHVINVLLHALAAVLLWRVLRRLKIRGAWLAAALFAVHPVHVESVAWITERKNVLSGVFYLWAALTFLKWDEAKLRGEARFGGYLLALLLYGGALMSKTVTSSLPAALVLALWWKDGFADGSASERCHSFIRQAWRRTWPLAPFFVVGLALSCLTIWLEIHHVGARGEEWHFTMIDRCLVAGRVIWFYAAKLIWPARLTFNYPRWDIDATAWWQYLYPLSFIIVVALLWAGRKRIGRGPLAAVLFFAGTLVPALGFFDVYPMRYSFVADHFQYHASIGLLALAAALMARGWQQLTAWTGSLAGPLGRGLSSAVLLFLLGTLSWKQCGIYQGLETLWLDTIEKNPASWMAYSNLGKVYLEQGRAEEATPLLEQALVYNPHMGTAYRNIGVALSKLGRIDEAMKSFHRALEVDPQDAETYSNMGAVLAGEGQFKDAVPYYLKALEINPDMAMTHSSLGSALGRIGRVEDAIRHHRKAVDLMPDLADVYYNYGEALHLAGRLREAEEKYRMAISLDPTSAASHVNLGLIATEHQLLPAAIHHFRRAVEEGPDLPDAHLNLATALAATSLTTEASQHFEIAVQLDPKSIKTRMAYAEFLLQQGNRAGASREYIAATALNPGTPDLHFRIGLLAQQLGDTPAAEEQFRLVLQHNSEHAPAHNHLAVLLAARGKKLDALSLLQRAVKLAPDDAESHNNLGVILVRLGKHQEALASLEKAVRLRPDYSDARNNLDDLRRLLTDKEGSS